jgi:hypothetical protein
LQFNRDPKDIPVSRRQRRSAGFSLLRRRNQADNELRESERRLEQAQRMAHVGYWERDLDADRVTWSDGSPPYGSRMAARSGTVF